jgi:hypothetical protein
MENFLKSTVSVIFAALFLSWLTYVVYDEFVITKVDATVIDLQQQQILSGSKSSVKTNYRYIVITNKETFIVENSLINGKFDNSNIFFNLEKGKSYSFELAGFGKGFFTDYKNILSVKKL